MPRDPVKEDKALEVTKALHAKFLEAGCFVFAPMPTEAAAGLGPAHVDLRETPPISQLGFADLSVQALGYEKGANDPKVLVYVTKGGVRQLRNLQQEIDGVTIEVKKIGKLVVRPEMARATNRHGHVYRRNSRIACGSSCAPVGESYSGTFGALVRKTGNRKIYMLSNNHVFAACNHTVVGMPITSPSNSDGRPNLAPLEIGQHSEIVELRSGVPSLVAPCTADVALASVTDETRITSWQGDDTDGFDTPTTVRAPSSGMRVKKFGRTTGFSIGVVESFIPVDVALPYTTKKFTATVWFREVWAIRSDDGEFALQGDSGSLVVSENGANAIGLVFAVDPPGHHTYVIPMDHIVTLFGGLRLVANHGV